MNQQISTIFLDVGNTLRVLVKDEAYQAHARRQIAALVGTTESPESFCERLDARYKVYRKWAFETLIEASEKELWTRWLLADFPAEKIVPIAGELTYQFRQSMGRREMVRDAKSVIVELSRRGYRLGIISNVITVREIPEWLEADGLSQYFQSVLLSSVFGKRKPDPSIYVEAARQAGVAPAQSAYLGDNPSRDVAGTRLAGFGMVILMMEPADMERKPISAENQPDVLIHEFRELLNVFPVRTRRLDEN